MQAKVLEKDSPCITPNLDRLASMGIRFRNAYTPNAVCSPARASLMTGLLPHNHGVVYVTHNVDRDQSCLRLDKPHWAQKLMEAGYHTGYFGKWHIERTENLQQFGWEVNGGEWSQLYKNKKKELTGGIAETPYSLVRYNEDPPGYDAKKVLYGVTALTPEKRMMGISTALALDFLEDAMGREEPWCCFVSVKEPHDPFICGEEAFRQYDVDSLEVPENAFDDFEGKPNVYKKASRVWKGMTLRERKEAMTCYYASVSEIDGQFGRLIRKVEEAGRLEDTLIVLTSDHGELLGAHGLYCKNISAFEEVYNIPLVMAGPNLGKGRVSQARVGLHDLAQTLLEIAGCEAFPVPDSKAFTPLLYSPEKEDEYQKGFAEYFGGRMLLTQRIVWDGLWKFIFNGFDFDELYNLQEDPWEMTNLAGREEYDEVVRRMCGQMWRMIRDTEDHSLYKSDYPILRLAPYGPGVIME